MAFAEKTRMRTTDVQELIRLTKSPDELTRVAAIAQLSKYGSSEAVPCIVSALKDTSANVKITALNALRDIGDSRAVSALIDVMKERESAFGEAFFSVNQPSFRSMAADALGAIGDKRAVPALIHMAEHDWISQRYSAAMALGQIGDPRGLPIIKKVMESMKEFPYLAEQLRQFVPGAAKATPRKLFDDLEQRNPDAVNAVPRGGKLITDLDGPKTDAAPRKLRLLMDLDQPSKEVKGAKRKPKLIDDID